MSPDAHMSSPSSSASAPSSAMTSPAGSPSINPHSLVDPAVHSPHTLRLISLPITQHLIDYIVDEVIETVDHAMNRPSTLLAASSSSSPTAIPTRPRTPTQQKFSTFASSVITRSEITSPTLLLALVYIHRARPFLHIALEEWALERVFLGALIVASKYANDSTLKNVHWALCTGVFGKRDVGRIEREFLAVLEWDLGVTEQQLLGLWEGLEWAVEEKERVEREKQAKEEKEKLRQLQLLERQREQQRQQQQQQAQKSASGSKFFLYSGEDSETRRPAKDVPALPVVRPRYHRRSNAPPPLSVNVTTTRTTAHTHTLPIPDSSRTHGHSPSSSSMSSASSTSSSESSSPTTPAEDNFHMQQYIVIEDGDAERSNRTDAIVSPSSANSTGTPQKKRGFGASTIELLKSFPFPGHHHHSQHQKRAERESSQPHPYAHTISAHGKQGQQQQQQRYATEGPQRPMKRLPLRTVS